ncbi:hypothetical protein D3C75_1078530 [compost metagenome]
MQLLVWKTLVTGVFCTNSGYEVRQHPENREIQQLRSSGSDRKTGEHECGWIKQKLVFSSRPKKEGIPIASSQLSGFPLDFFEKLSVYPSRNSEVSDLS